MYKTKTRSKYNGSAFRKVDCNDDRRPNEKIAGDKETTAYNNN